MPTIRLAILGDRDATTAYASAASRVSGIELVSIDDDSIGAIVVTSTVSDATDISTKAAAGKHLLIDMLLTSAIDAVTEAKHDNAGQLMVGGSLRFTPSHRAVKESLKSGKLGAPGLLRIHRWRAGGDPLFMARELDLAIWLFESMPTAIYAAQSPGYVQLHLGFPDGGMALIDFSTALPGGDDYFSLSMIGSAGATYADEHHNVQLLYRGGHPSALKTGQGNTHLVVELQEFAAAIEQNREPSITAADARAAIQVAEAVENSMTSGRALRLIEGNYDFA